MLERVHHENRPEDDRQRAKRLEEAVCRPGEGCERVLSPISERDDQRRQPPDRQGNLGRQPEHQHGDDHHQDRQRSN